MHSRIIEEIKNRRKRIAGLLLSEKTLQKKDILALNLELYAASQAIDSAQRYLLTEELRTIKQLIEQGEKTTALKRVQALTRLINRKAA